MVQLTAHVSLSGLPVLTTLYKLILIHKRNKSQNCDFFSGSTFIFVKNTQQIAANLMFGLILAVAKVPWCFLEGQFMHWSVTKTQCGADKSTSISRPGGYEVYILASNMPKSPKTRKRLQDEFLSLLLSNQTEILKRGMTWTEQKTKGTTFKVQYVAIANPLYIDLIHQWTTK